MSHHRWTAVTRMGRKVVPDVGSSKNIILGRLSSSMVMETRFLSPPEMPFFLVLPMMTSLQCEMPMRFRTSLIRSWRCAVVVPLAIRS